MQLRHLVLLLLSTLALLATAQAPPPLASAMRVVTLQNLEVANLQPLLGMPLFTRDGLVGDFPFTPLADLVPKEIDALIGMTQTNCILIRAKAPTLAAANAAIDNLAALLTMLDRPQKRIIIEVTLVESTYGATRALGGTVESASGGASVKSQNGGGDGALQMRILRGQSRAAISGILAEERAKVFSTAKVMVMQNGSGYISLTGTELPLDTLSVRKATALPNGEVTMQIEPVYSLDGVYCDTPVVRARDGEAVFLGMLGGPAITKTTADAPRPLKLALPRRLNLSESNPVILLYATPTVLPEELEDPFPVFKPLAPLF